MVGNKSRRLLRDFQVLRYTLDAVEVQFKLRKNPMKTLSELAVASALCRSPLLYQLAGRFGKDLGLNDDKRG